MIFILYMTLGIILLLKNYKSYGIKEVDYEPAKFDSGAQKFVWVRQKYSCLCNETKTKQIK